MWKPTDRPRGIADGLIASKVQTNVFTTARQIAAVLAVEAGHEWVTIDRALGLKVGSGVGNCLRCWDSKRGNDPRALAAERLARDILAGRARDAAAVDLRGHGVKPAGGPRTRQGPRPPPAWYRPGVMVVRRGGRWELERAS